MIGKTCTRCGHLKSLTSFAINSKGLYGYKSVCKDCSNLAQRELEAKRKKENPKEWKEKRKHHNWKYNYGLSPESYRELLDKQNGECAICGTQGILFVDHCHTTNRVRGLLCRHCNTLLGMAKDQPKILAAAKVYLLKQLEEEYGGKN